MQIDLTFPVAGTALPLDHAYLLYASLAIKSGIFTRKMPVSVLPQFRVNAEKTATSGLRNSPA